MFSIDPLRRVALALPVAALLVGPSVGWAQRLPPGIAAAANPVSDGQALVKKGDFTSALAKFGDAERAANAIQQAPLRVFYQIESRLGSATALDGLKRYDDALGHADWANDAANAPQNNFPASLKGAVHHLRGVVLYHLGRFDEAKAMFEQAGGEGDQTAALWQRAIDKASASAESAPALAAAADAASQHGQPADALSLYVEALQQYDDLGDKAPSVVEHALMAALAMQPPPPVPDGAAARLKAADEALRGGAPADLQAARDLLRESLIEIPWWADGWQRLADVEEKLGDPAAARGALRFYLKAAPHAGDRAAVEQRIASLGQAAASTAAAPPAPAPAPAASVPVADISGHWSTTDGRVIEVKQNGNQVSWVSCCRKGHEDLVVNVSATFDGRNVVGTYHYREGQAEGNGTVSLTLAGDRLEGVWKTPSGKTLDAMLIRHQENELGTLSGKWVTVAGRAVTLSQNGTQVNWTTCCRQAHPSWTADISGTFDGKNLVGTYHWRDGGEQGNGTVSYVLKGNQLEGTLDRPGKEPYHSLLTRQTESKLTGKWTNLLGATSSFTQNGNNVAWTTCCRPGFLNYSAEATGNFDGKNLVGTFHWREGAAQGDGVVSYTLNGDKLEGTAQRAGQQPVPSVLTRQ